MGRQYRAATIDTGSIDEEKMTVGLSFSSEEPVRRWFGWEKLSHKKSDVDLSRLNDGAAVLVDHYSDQVGIVEKAKIQDKRGIATVRFSPNSEYAKSVFNDIRDGIRKNVSVGYEIHEFVLERQDEDSGESHYSAKWEPLEISIVGVPADKTVGVGRSKETFEVEVPEDFPVENQGSTEENLVDEANERKISPEEQLQIEKLKLYLADD